MDDIEIAKSSFFKGVACLEKQEFAGAERLFLDTLKLAPRSISTLLNLAIAQHEQRKNSEAEQTAKQAIAIDPKNIDAYLMLATCLKEQEKYEEALAASENLIDIDETNAEAHCDRGYVLNELGRYEEAIESFDRALSYQPQFAIAFLNRGNALLGLKRYDEAALAYDKALANKPDLKDAWLGRGNVFYELKHHDEAVLAYDKALAIKPESAEAWLGRGNVFYELKRYDEAALAYDKALANKPDLKNAWLGRGNVFYELKRYDEAVLAYDKALAIKPESAEAWLGRGNVFHELKRYDEAVLAYDKALAIKLDSAEAWLGRGNVFYELKRYNDAVLAYDEALAIKPDLAEAWLGRGNVFYYHIRHNEASAAYDKALALKPGLEAARGVRLHSKMHLCDWDTFDVDCAHLTSSIRKGNVSAIPSIILTIPSSAEDQLQYAKLWTAQKYPPSEKPIWHGERYNHDRIRLAYLSADFRDHPVSYLLAGMFECHDKRDFDVTAISFGPDNDSEMRRRIAAAFEHFIDVQNYSDDQVADLVKKAEIDILVDLMGFTRDSRTSIFARRPAPIQINYLGYLGTMGTEYIDYIIADKTVIPEPQRDFYSEKIVYLPNSFQPTDRKRHISDKKLTRAEVGLPQEGFVYCCFNTNYKITPEFYDIWMRILKRVDGSVLWLVANSPTTERNLKHEAAARGINPERLILAPIMPLPDHQARLRLADLFLDTLPYNAGATASDTLWAGLPVLTSMGNTFVGRMAASVLNAIGLPELITTTPQAYEALAIDLSVYREKLETIKQKLARNRLATALFDTRLYTAHIEAAYTMMYERHQARLAPDHIHVPR